MSLRGDNILTLSTCSGEDRLVVHAKLVSSVPVFIKSCPYDRYEAVLFLECGAEWRPLAFSLSYVVE